MLWIILKVNVDGTNLVLNRGNSSLLHPAPWVRGTLSAHLAKIIQFKNWKQQQGPFTSASFSKYASSALSTKTVVLSYAGRPGTQICNRICTSAWSQAMKDYAFKELCTGHLYLKLAWRQPPPWCGRRMESPLVYIIYLLFKTGLFYSYFYFSFTFLVQVSTPASNLVV